MSGLSPISNYHQYKRAQTDFKVKGKSSADGRGDQSRNSKRERLNYDYDEVIHDEYIPSVEPCEDQKDF